MFEVLYAITGRTHICTIHSISIWDCPIYVAYVIKICRKLCHNYPVSSCPRSKSVVSLAIWSYKKKLSVKLRWTFGVFAICGCQSILMSAAWKTWCRPSSAPIDWADTSLGLPVSLKDLQLQVQWAGSYYCLEQVKCWPTEHFSYWYLMLHT